MGLKPGSAKWRRTITASKVGAILGISPHTSQYAQWHEMAGNVKPNPFDDHTAKFGHFAELMLGPWWESEEDGRELGEHEPTFTDPDRGWVATPDYIAKDADGEMCVVECKTAKSLDEWSDEEGEPAVPAHYFAQVIFQLALTGFDRGYVVVLGSFKQIETFRIDFDPELWAGVEDQLVAWEQSLSDGVPPELDDTPATLQTVRKLHKDITRDKEVEIQPELARHILAAKKALDEAQKKYDAYEIVGRDLMEDAHRLVCGGEKIADRRGNAHGSTNWIVNKKARIYE